jgi:hypothetical protein
VKGFVSELPQCVECVPDMLDDFGGPSISRVVSPIKLIGCNMKILDVSPSNGDTTTDKVSPADGRSRFHESGFSGSELGTVEVAGAC